MRRAVARRRLRWRARFRELRERRQQERRWQQDRAVLTAIAGPERQLFATRLFVGRERVRVTEEVAAERQSFETGWVRWEKSLNKYYLNRPLGEKWVAHVDRRTQQTLYFNADTGKNQAEHPGDALARSVRKSERVKATRALKKRLAVLEEYLARLQQGEARERALLTQRVEEAYQAALTRS